MENLSKDVKGLIAENLSGEDILALSNASKKMKGISSYNELWKRKIEEEFKINYKGKSACEEYKFLNRLSQTIIYNVIYVTNQDEISDDVWVESFISEDLAMEFIIQEVIHDIMWNLRNPNIEKEEISKKVRADLERFNTVDYENGYLILKQNHLGNHGLHSRGYQILKI